MIPPVDLQAMSTHDLYSREQRLLEQLRQLNDDMHAVRREMFRRRHIETNDAIKRGMWP